MIDKENIVGYSYLGTPYYSDIIFQKGTNRSLNLTCASFTDNSTSPLISKVMELSYGTLTWNIVGDLAFNHKFFVIEGLVSEAASANKKLYLPQLKMLQKLMMMLLLLLHQQL